MGTAGQDEGSGEGRTARESARAPRQGALDAATLRAIKRMQVDLAASLPKIDTRAVAALNAHQASVLKTMPKIDTATLAAIKRMQADLIASLPKIDSRTFGVLAESQAAIAQLVELLEQEDLDALSDVDPDDLLAQLESGADLVQIDSAGPWGDTWRIDANVVRAFLCVLAVLMLFRLELSEDPKAEVAAAFIAAAGWSGVTPWGAFRRKDD